MNGPCLSTKGRTFKERRSAPRVRPPFANVGVELERDEEERLVDVEVHGLERVVCRVVVDQVSAHLARPAKTGRDVSGAQKNRRQRDELEHLEDEGLAGLFGPFDGQSIADI